MSEVEYIGDKLFGYTGKMVFSHADIMVYMKIKKTKEVAGSDYQEWTEQQMTNFTTKISGNSEDVLSAKTSENTIPNTSASTVTSTPARESPLPTANTSKHSNK
jgi:hypothetical protein